MRTSASTFHPCAGVGGSEWDAGLMLAGPWHCTCPHLRASRRCHQAGRGHQGGECFGGRCHYTSVPHKAHRMENVAMSKVPPTCPVSFKSSLPAFQPFHPKASQLARLSTGKLDIHLGAESASGALLSLPVGL